MRRQEGHKPGEETHKPNPFNDAMERELDTWMQKDVGAVMNSKAYLDPHHPQYESAQEKVRAWFGRAYGDQPAGVMP